MSSHLAMLHNELINCMKFEFHAAMLTSTHPGALSRHSCVDRQRRRRREKQAWTPKLVPSAVEGALV